MTKEQIEQDIKSWEGHIQTAHAEIKKLKENHTDNFSRIAALNEGISNFRKIINKKKYELSKYR